MPARAPAVALFATLTATTASVPPALAQEADELTPVTFGTNWIAQAEHGGFYQALADGTYAACGLDVTIVPGGPQVNNRALFAAGQMDFYMGGGLLSAFNARAEGVPTVIVAAIMQKHPQVILAHPGKAETFADLADLRVMISNTGYLSFFQWMKEAYGFTDERREPYTFNAAPFIVDEERAMQGYLTSEPYTVAKEAGFEPDVFLLADAGYSSYATTIEVLEDTLADRPEAVECFVSASVQGWDTYLNGDRSAADALIREDNPDKTQDAIDYAVNAMVENGIVQSGDALERGIGALDPARVRRFHDEMVEAGVIEPLPDDALAAMVDDRFVGGAAGADAPAETDAAAETEASAETEAAQ